MRTSFRLAAVTLVIAAGLSLGGCAPYVPAPKPTPAPSATPMFATDEEALAAAEEAYAAYLRAVDAMLQSGGIDVSNLAGVATSDALEQASADADEFRKLGYRTTGFTLLRSIMLQQQGSGASDDNENVVVAYICEDASGIDLLDSHGLSVVAGDRENLTPFEVSFGRPDDAARLLVASRTLWSGAGPCSG